MSNNVLIGVGGSGQHVVHAYLNLLALGNTPAGEVPYVLIIDADVTDNSPLYHSIKELHKRLTSPLDGLENQATLAVMRPYPAEDANKSKTSGQALGIANAEAWLTDALLIDDTDFSGFSDKDIKINQGMMANARIGSAVFNTVDPLKSLGSIVKGKQVAIVGSTFGGTGSGVIPTLVRLLDAATSNQADNIRAFMTLPWFEITGESSKGKSAAHASGELSPMKRNAALGLRTYKQELSGFKRSSYVITQFLSGQHAQRPDDGNFDQKEHKHVFNLVLANAVQNFFYISSQASGQLMTLKARGDELNGTFNAAESVNLRFLRLFLDSKAETDKNEVSLEELMINTELTALVLEKAAVFIAKGNNQFKVPKADSAKEPKGLRGFVEALYKDNHGELPGRGFLSKVMDSVPKHLEPIYQDLASALKKQADILRDSLVWLRSHIASEQNPTGLVTSKPILPLFTIVQASYRPLLEEELKKEVHKQVYWPRDLVVKNMQANGSDLSVEKTDKITLAYYIFLNTFYQEANGKSSDAGHEAELKVRVDKANQSHSTDEQRRLRSYAIAAQLLTEKIYEQIVAAREVVERPPHNANEQLPKEMLKGFDDLSTTNEDNNLIFFKFAQNDLGLLDNGQIKSEHPYSICYLDPFLGVQQVPRLLKQPRQPEAGAVFMETALKGIPNIIAPLLLQKWRLSLLGEPNIFKDQSFSNKEPLKKVEPPESTPYGIYLHARRVVEAAFWLLFTQDARVKIQNKSLQESSFAGIVNSELKKYRDKDWHPEEGLRPLKYFIQSSANGMPLFLYDDIYGWYLAANREARLFFASIMSDLPSVKYGHSKLDSLWRGEEYQTQPMAKPETYDTGVINAFLGFLQQLPQLQPKPQWAAAVSDLIADLTSKGFKPTDLKELVVKTDHTPLPFSGQAEGLKLVSLANVEKVSLAELALDRPVFYYKTDNNDNLSPLQAKELLWPLKGLAWHFLNVPTLEKAVESFGTYSLLENKTRTVWAWESLILGIKGFGKKTFNQPFARVVGVDAKEDQFLWSVGVWPNVEMEGWGYYIALGDFNALQINNIDLNGHDLKGETVEFVFYGESKGTFAELGRSVHAVPVKLNGIPRSVEVVLGGRVLGSVPIGLTKRTSKNEGSACTLALDFGTSNSCMAIKVEGEDIVFTLPLLEGQKLASDDGNAEKPCELTGMTWSAGNYLSGREQKYYHQLLPSLFFQSFAAQATQSATIPTELLWAKGLGNQATSSRRIEFLQNGNQVKDYYRKFALLEKFGISDPKEAFAGELPIVAPFWTAFPPAISDSLRQQLAVIDGNNRYVDNFKWPSAALGDRRYGYRAVYLENMMAACFVALRLAGYSNVKELIATYPGAFTKESKGDQMADIKSYEQDLTAIVQELSLQCGISKPNITTRSETCAALAGCNRLHNDIALTIDMGGGTTDIGLLIPQDKDCHSYMASLRYAGNDLLKSIVEFDLTKPKNQDKKRETLLLEWKLRLREEKEPAFGEDTQAYRRISTAFFEGLFEYVFNMLTAHHCDLTDKEIKVYLLGNGFKLAKYFCCVGAKDQDKKEERTFFEGMVSQAQTQGALPKNIQLKLQQEGIDKKRALINGVFKITPGTQEGDQYLKIENKGYDAQPLLLPCVQINQEAKTQPWLAKKEDMKPDLVEITTNMLVKESAFKLTNQYWQHQDVNPDALFTNIKLETDGADLGKFYLEKKFVPEVLFKLVRAPQVKQSERTPQPAGKPATPDISEQRSSAPRTTATNVSPAPNSTPPSHAGQTIPTVLLTQNGQRAKHRVGNEDKFVILSGQITLRIGWRKPSRPTGRELDAEPTVILLGEDGKAIHAENALVFFNQSAYGNDLINVFSKEVCANVDKDSPYITISLDQRLPENIRTISVWAYIVDGEKKGESWSRFEGLYVEVLDCNNHRLIRADLPTDIDQTTALMFAEIYHTGDKSWKFKSGSGGYKPGFETLCRSYGLNVE